MFREPSKVGVEDAVTLDTPEWSVNRYPIFIPRSPVPWIQMTSSKQVSEIPYINLNKSFEELAWVFNIT